MALPAVAALADTVPRVTVQAPVWGAVLYRDLGVEVVARGTRVEAEVAVLMPPSLRVAWEARHIPRRVGVAADWRRWLLTDVVPEGRHQADTYAALVAVLGIGGEGAPTWRPRPSDPCPDLPHGHVGLNPVSVGGVVREWGGYAALAERQEQPVVFYGGPGEEERVAAAAGEHPMAVGLPLPELARALERCAVFVTNDSGAAHFARAVGTPTVVIFGSTTSSRTGAHGCVAVEGPELPCRPCYKQRCRFALDCLDITVERVEAVVREVLGG